jgi:hypothetical protein
MAQSRPIPTSYYYSGQGRLGIGDRNSSTGQLDNVLFVGNVTSLTLDIAVQKFEHKESMSGSRGVDQTVIQERNATFKFTAESLKLELLTLGLYGTQSTVALGTVTGETHIVKKGYAIPLKHPKVSAIVLKKAGTAINESTNYDYDAGFGTIYIKTAAADLTDGDAVTVDYSYAAYDKIESFTQGTAPEKFLRFEGLNTVDGTLRLIEIPRAAMDPLTGLEFINEEFGSGEFNGNILPDLTITGGGLSQYFREKRMS